MEPRQSTRSIAYGAVHPDEAGCALLQVLQALHDREIVMAKPLGAQVCGCNGADMLVVDCNFLLVFGVTKNGKSKLGSNKETQSFGALHP